MSYASMKFVRMNDNVGDIPGYIQSFIGPKIEILMREECSEQYFLLGKSLTNQKKQNHSSCHILYRKHNDKEQVIKSRKAYKF